jgi:hypothetical protein
MFGMSASCMAKVRFYFWRAEFISGKMVRDQKIQLLIQAHLFSGEKNELQRQNRKNESYNSIN